MSKKPWQRVSFLMTPEDLENWRAAYRCKGMTQVDAFEFMWKKFVKDNEENTKRMQKVGYVG